MPRNWDQFYALQDWALARFKEVPHGFHLTGGTALSRGYYHHRDSDDLDLFANDARCLARGSPGARVPRRH